MKTKIGTFDATPTWASLVDMLLDGVENGTVERSDYCYDEIKRMAEVCDNYVALQKITTKKGVDPACAMEMYEALISCQDYFDYMNGQNHVMSRPCRDLTKKAIKNATLKP